MCARPVNSPVSRLLRPFIRVRSESGRQKRRQLFLESLEDRRLMAGTTYLLDLNSLGTPTAAGHTGVLPTTVYPGSGFGWDSALVSSGASSQGAFDRGLSVPVPDPKYVALRRDGHYSQAPHTFEVALPSETYAVNVTLGDANFGRDQMRVQAEGTELANVTLGPGQWTTVFSQVAVNDGRLDLRFSDLGGDPYWTVNGIQIRPWAEVANKVAFTPLTPTGPRTADGLTEDVINGTGPANTLITLSTTLGTIVTDAAPEYVGTQALTNGAGEFSFRVRRPITPGTPPTPIFAGTAVDGSATGTSSLVTPVVTYEMKTNGLLFDMNGSGSPNQPGYLSVLPETTYNATRGYGWDSPLTSTGSAGQGAFDRGAFLDPQSALLQDGHYSKVAHTFRVKVESGKDYGVRVYVGDRSFGRDQIKLTVEGGSPVAVPNTAPGQFTSVVVPAVSVSADGVLDLGISDAGGDPYWVVNGVEVWQGTNDPAPPPAVTLQLAPTSISETGGVATVTARLAAPTGRKVTVDLTFSGTASATAPADYARSVDTIEIPAGSWSGVSTLTAMPDLVDEPNETIIVEITGATYAVEAVPQTVICTIVDDDTAGVTMTPSSGLVTTEDGGFATFTAVLNSPPRPLSNVTLTLAGDATEGTLTPGVLTFDDTNWNTPQLVKVTGVPDGVLDGNILYAIQTTSASSDPAYQGLAVPRVWVTNKEVASVTVSPASGPTNEAGGTATFTVGLTAQPTANVTIGLVSSDTTEGTVPPSITFTPANWNASQTVTVTGVNDWFVDGDIAYTIITTVSSADPQYAGIFAADVSVTNQDNDVAGSQALRFDMNAFGSLTQSGFIGVLPTDAYSATRGYGWDVPLSSGEGGFDRGDLGWAQSNLLRDGHWSAAPHTFRANLPNGVYWVSATIGDVYARDAINIIAEKGTVWENSLEQPVSTPAGQWRNVGLQVRVDDGELDVQFSDGGGDPYWVVNELSVRPFDEVQNPVNQVEPPFPALADGLPSPYTVTVAAAGEDRWFTVTATNGVILNPDDELHYAGVQVLVPASVPPLPTTTLFTVQLQSPTASGNVTVSVAEVTGAAVASVNTIWSVAPVRRFDFNGPEEDTAAGFLGVRGSDVYTAARGYGWTVAVPEFERSAAGISKTTAALYRDGHYGSEPRTFQVEVVPTNVIVPVIYSLRFYAGDRLYARDNIQIAVEGGPTVLMPDTAGNTFAWVNGTGTDTNFDGRLDVTISDAGGDAYWVLNGIDIWLDPNDPHEAPLRAGQVGSPGAAQAQRLTDAALAPVVEQAIGIWAGTGLSPAQVSLLWATPVAIANLDAQGCLGVTTPERILIDDDGVGLGWDIPSGSGLSTPSSRPSYDLLTAVLHEMGHVLGRSHDTGDDLMGAVLQPGVRHLPELDTVFAAW